MSTMQSRLGGTVGSTPWIAEEQENIQQFIEQETEDFAFSARNEVEWLNEHMAEIFTSNQFNVTEIFKTPGKLRGKTPRTTRKKNPLEARIPLSDVFSTKQQQLQPSPSHEKRSKQASPFVVAADPEPVVVTQPTKIALQPTDSGYHGSTEDEMEMDAPEIMNTSVVESEVQRDENEREVIAISRKTPSEGRRTTEGSFHSAQEAITTTIDATIEVIELENKLDEVGDRIEEDVNELSSPFQERTKVEPAQQLEPVEVENVNKNSLDEMMANNFEDIGSPSDGSTPDRLLTRKSSLTFASLPPREPLKQSIGLRTSHADQVARGRSSYYGRLTNGRLTQPAEDTEADKMDVDYDTQTLDRDMSDAESQTRTLHNKSSTQRLHDRINMLGASRPSKSIPAVVPAAPQVTYPEIPVSKPDQSVQHNANTTIDDDDDWIKPLGSPMARPALAKSHTTDVMENIHGKESIGELGWVTQIPKPIDVSTMRTSPGPKAVASPVYAHGKSASTTVLPSPSKASMMPEVSHKKTISVSNPNLAEQSYTPMGSPKRLPDGPSSAKLRLQSIMKTAKGLFTSSAGISAAAKMETLSPSMKMLANTNNGLYPSLDPAKQRALPLSPSREDGRRTRSSTENQKKKEREAKEQQKVTDELDKAREKERQKAAQFKQDRDKALPSLPSELMPPPAQTTRSSPRKRVESKPEEVVQPVEQQKSIPRPTNIQGAPQRPAQARRPVKPTRDGPPKVQPPQRVEIKLNHRVPLSTAALAQKLEDSLPPPAPPKQTGLMKKASNASLTTTTSSTSFKTSTSTKPKALLAAERKKEQEEREKQRREEQKQELARKRAAQQEQARREEQKQRAEVEKRERDRVAAEEVKKVAQKEAIEKRRIENAKKQDELRNARNAQERHNDLGGPRPASRLMNTAQPPNRSAMNAPPNPPRHPKHALEEEEARSVIRIPGPGATYHPTDANKRRRTDDNDDQEPARSTMGAPPVRQSNIRKEPPKASIFSHSSYAPAPQPPSINAPPPILKSTIPPHHPPNQLYRGPHPNEMAKYAQGKIPFSDAPNPPQSSSSTTAYANKPPRLLKSSPQVPNADHFPLPEIHTDSESDSDASPNPSNSFPKPAWASPSAIEAALLHQESMNPDAIFGPIANIQMDEIFRGADKGRMKRWRDRTSSANWERSGDLLTREEMEKDRVGREELRREGGWRVGMGGN